MRQFHDEELALYKPQFAFSTAASGRTIVADNYRTLLRHVVQDTLCEQVRWDKLLQYCEEDLSTNPEFTQFAIYPITSNASHLITSSVSKKSDKTVTVEDFKRNPALSSEPDRLTGKFEQSKIAIVGYSGRFPEARSNGEFWDLLHHGRDVHRTIPEDRFNWQTHYDPTGKRNNTSRVRFGCFVNEPGLFDARFFNMSPREAENTDPAQRLVTTTSYEAMEMAGMVPNRTPSTQQDRIGVFFGTTSDDWK